MKLEYNKTFLLIFYTLFTRGVNKRVRNSSSQIYTGVHTPDKVKSLYATKPRNTSLHSMFHIYASETGRAALLGVIGSFLEHIFDDFILPSVVENKL